MRFKLLKNSKSRKTIFYSSITVLVLLLFFAIGLSVHGLSHDTHYLDESGNLNVFSIINISIDITSYIVGLVIFICLGFEPIRKRNNYFSFMCLIASIMLNLFVDVVSWFSNGIMDMWKLTFVSEMLYYILSYTCVYFFLLYIVTISDIDKFKTKRAYISYLVFYLVSVLIVLIASFTGNLFTINEKGFYDVEVSMSFWAFMPMLIMHVLAIYLVAISKKKSKNTLVLLIAVILPIAVNVLEAFYINLQLEYTSMMISVLILMSTIHLAESVELESKRAELNNQKLTQMMNQIQPHFIYNVLSSIYYLCDKDGARAKAAINDFSRYLRINVDSVDKKPIVSFKDEFEYCKVYLSLEKMRFDDELNIEYDVETTDFQVPSFSVQPLIENAVKHGVSQKDGGGTVKIQVREAQNEYVIRIIDDGVGFDDSDLFGDGKNHVGIKNVKYRIEALTGGNLAIKSKIGEGTISEITIPKEK